MLMSLRHFDQSEVAKERLKILNFYDEFGGKTTEKAFGVNRKLIYVWRKRLKHCERRLKALVPDSTKPKVVRRMTTNHDILSFIKKLRKNKPRIGKEKIKPLLDRYCQGLNIATISVSTIGKVIKRNHFISYRAL